MGPTGILKEHATRFYRKTPPLVPVVDQFSNANNLFIRVPGQWRNMEIIQRGKILTLKYLEGQCIFSKSFFLIFSKKGHKRFF